MQRQAVTAREQQNHHLRNQAELLRRDVDAVDLYAIGKPRRSDGQKWRPSVPEELPTPPSDSGSEEYQGFGSQDPLIRLAMKRQLAERAIADAHAQVQARDHQSNEDAPGLENPFRRVASREDTRGATTRGVVALPQVTPTPGVARILGPATSAINPLKKM
jgi:hypothetical protein